MELRHADEEAECPDEERHALAAVGYSGERHTAADKKQRNENHQGYGIVGHFLPDNDEDEDAQQGDFIDVQGGKAGKGVAQDVASRKKRPQDLGDAVDYGKRT
jgi:hypothetical protein